MIANCSSGSPILLHTPSEFREDVWCR